MTTDLQRAIRALESAVEDPTRGLPEEVFLLVSRLVPMVNVDLLVQNETCGTLLTWRDDGLVPPGWHIPGGIIRFQETAATRIRETARRELGAEVEFQPAPLALFEHVDPTRTTRGHFISMLFRCRLLGPPAAELRYDSGVPAAGQWAWHTACPADMIDVYRHYRRYFHSSG